jgi:hypothetical protein
VIFIPAQNWAATGAADAPPAALAAGDALAAATGAVEAPAALAAGDGLLDELHALTTNRTANANAGNRHCWCIPDRVIRILLNATDSGPVNSRGRSANESLSRQRPPFRPGRWDGGSQAPAGHPVAGPALPPVSTSSRVLLPSRVLNAAASDHAAG